VSAKAERLANLRARYATRLPERVSELRAAFEIAATSSTPEGWGGLWKLFHNMAGSAGGYGFPRVGQLANAAQAALRGASESARAPSSEERRQVTASLDSMPQAILEDQDELGPSRNAE